MRRLSGLMVALVLVATPAFAADVSVFFVVPGLAGADTPAAAQGLGVAPVVPRVMWDGGDLDGIPNASIPVEIWMSLNSEGINHTAVGYQNISGGGWDLAGDNNDLKGSGMNLFKTFNTNPASARRWDSASATGNGAAGGAGYVWQGTLFDQGLRSGVSTSPFAAGPALPDAGTNYFLIMTGSLNVDPAGFTDSTGILDSFFDIFFELRNGDFGAGPVDPVAMVEWGFDGPDFFGSNSVSGGTRSPFPQLRIEVPEPATMALLGLGGLLLRRRR